MYKLKKDGKVHATGYTSKEAYKCGWTFWDISWARGYISRKYFTEDKAEVFEAGGIRTGKIYYNVPAYKSKQYHYRIYLHKTINPMDETIKRSNEQ